MNGTKLTYKINCNSKSIQNKIDSLIDDDLMLKVHQRFAEIVDPWTPYRTGATSRSGLTQVKPDRVIYGGGKIDYDVYIYYGTHMNFNPQFHPLATAMWDKVAMQTERDTFAADVEELLKDKAKAQ